MKWKRIPKENAVQPDKGTYEQWKPIVADEGSHQCVYCAIHEAVFGGIRNFHVEHYRPKSLKQFKHLRDDITNLYYACPVCNTFKSNDWPNDPVDDHSVRCYPDPSKTDYCALFDVNPKTGVLEGKYVASRYLEKRIHLNRNQLVMERRVYLIRERAKGLREAIWRLLQKIDESDQNGAVVFAMRYISLCNRLEDLRDREREIPPYLDEDLKRKK